MPSIKSHVHTREFKVQINLGQLITVMLAGQYTASLIRKGVSVRVVINLDPVLGLYLGLREGSISDGEVSLESRL